MRVPMATSAASAVVTGLAEKKCHNVYREPHPNDPTRENVLIEAPGSLQRADFAGGCRGMWQADGHASGQVLIAQGTTLSTFAPGSNSTGSLTGTITGNDRGDFAFTETQGFGLFNGGLYVSTGTAIAAVTDPQFATLLSDASATAFTSVDTLGQRGLFTYRNRFGFTAVLALDDVTALNYYTAESSPDDIIAGRVLGEFYYLMGSQTIEVWSQTGDSADPFSMQAGMTQQVGCACRDGIVKADNSLFFVDEAFNVRRLGQGGSPIVSEPWVSAALRSAGAANIIGKTYQDRGHIFVSYRTPTACMFFDVLTQEWHTRGTNLQNSWRYTDIITAAGRVFVCDETGQFDELSRDYASESMATAFTMGTEIVREFTAHMSGVPDSLPVTTLRLESAKGVGVATGQGVDPIVRMRASVDGGNTWTNWRDRKLGAQGVYDQRTVWHRCGRTRLAGMVFQFQKSDPAPTAYLGVIVNEDL